MSSPVGALRPHWLDEVFEDPDTAAARFSQHPKTREAFEKATAAFKKREKELEENPKLLGATPAQAARVAFLEVMQSPT